MRITPPGYAVLEWPDVLSDGTPCHVAAHPELPGCVVHGRDRVEALRFLGEAREVWILSATLDGSPIPKARNIVTMIAWSTGPKQAPGKHSLEVYWPPAGSGVTS